MLFRSRELVEFAEEYEFTRQYLAFEQLRYEERLKVDLRIDPAAFEFDVLPFSLQTLAALAVHSPRSLRKSARNWDNDQRGRRDAFLLRVHCAS